MTLIRQYWSYGEQPSDPQSHRPPNTPTEPTRLPPLASLITGPFEASPTGSAPTRPPRVSDVHQSPQVPLGDVSRSQPPPASLKQPQNSISPLPIRTAVPLSEEPWRPREESYEPLDARHGSLREHSSREMAGPRQYAPPHKTRREPPVSPAYAQKDAAPLKVAIPFTPQALRSAHMGPGKAHNAADPGTMSGEASPERREFIVQRPEPLSQRDGHIQRTLIVRQQPVAARACGAGDKDRRVIDPPPILQMFISGPGLSDNERRARLSDPHCVVTSTIYDKTGTQDLSTMIENRLHQKRLIGSLAVTPFIGEDENGEMGCFFPFPDLSVRTIGEFRIKFAMVCIVTSDIAKPGRSFRIREEVMTDVFTVYSAKDFPGMSASTALTRRLKVQGCMISIKKGKSGGQVRRKYASDDSEEDDDDDETRSAASRKRSKKRR